MLNALANHGYLPRDGKNISLADLIVGFRDAINLSPDATLIVGLKALQASSTGKLVTLHLDDLAKHGSKYWAHAEGNVLIPSISN
jgi:hypothetical protein